MGVKNPPREVKQAFKFWNIWGGVVSRGHHYIVKCIAFHHLIFGQVFDNNSKVIGVFVVNNIFDSHVKLDKLFDVFFVPSSLQVVKEYFSWRKGRYLLLKMVFKGIVGKLNAFFWRIRPKVP